jgi:hypothetical protein
MCAQISDLYRVDQLLCFTTDDQQTDQNTKKQTTCVMTDERKARPQSFPANSNYVACFLNSNIETLCLGSTKLGARG